MPLNTISRRLLPYLVDHIRSPSFHPARPATFLFYGQVHAHLGLDLIGDTVGVSLDRHCLLNLASTLQDAACPALTGIIIDRNTRVPGRQFFTLHGRSDTDYQWWLDEVASCAAFKWDTVLLLNQEAQL